MNGLAFGTDRKAEAESIPAPVASDVSDLIEKKDAAVAIGSWKAGLVIAIGLANYNDVGFFDVITLTQANAGPASHLR